MKRIWVDIKIAFGVKSNSWDIGEACLLSPGMYG